MKFNIEETKNLLNHDSQSIIFNAAGREIIKLSPNGDIFVNGKLVENDKEVVEGMRELITNS
ncbi:hypothetical protein JOC34_000581 [Virgibacillus halotolerans]|uniref:hypothetical protein n=1 Tax=Virgibacillus halotolerans TaxID=1071053 RepID=UPI001960D5D1|nr:hypothetical protein [Virgibacillus halotolerans]MBM7598224.1 hypothetical protein [Virgibacillus halotolerans]